MLVDGSLHLHLILISSVTVIAVGILVLLVFRYEVVHIGLSLGELHLVHAFLCVPVKPSFAPVHRCELLSDSFEGFLDCSGVAHESSWHRQASRWDVTNWKLDVVWDPLDEIWWVLAGHVEHLLFTLFGGDSSTEHSSCSKVASVARISGAHHVFGVKHLSCELGNG